MRRVAAAALAIGCSMGGANAQEPEAEPGLGLEFFEYLGAWAEDDDEWLAIEEWEKDQGAEPDEDSAESESEREDEDDDESE